MPRPYSEGIPAGDPTNIYALITNGIDVPTVQFTPQDRVAEPYNEWAALNRILNTGTAAAAEAMNFKAQQIENKTAYVNLVNRLEDDAIRTKEENQREFDRQVKENQDNAFLTAKTKVQRAILDNDYNLAADEAMKFAQIPEYSIENNPYMAEKATDLVGYVEAKKKQAEAETRTENKRLSSAAQSTGTLLAAKVIESYEIQFKDDAQRPRVMGLFETAEPEQITERLHDLVMNEITRKNPEIRAVLDDQDLNQLTTYIWDRSATLRNGITEERNRARIFYDMEMKGKALLNDAMQIRDVSVDVPNVLEYFKELDVNPDITTSQRNKLKDGGTAIIVDQAKKGVPVRGALDVREEINLQAQSGNISIPDAASIVRGLTKRAERELEGQIAEFESRATSQAGEGNENIALAMSEEFKGNNPAIAIAERYGLATRNADGSYQLSSDPQDQGMIKKLQQLEQRWITQQERFTRENNLKSDIDVVNIIGVSNFQYDRVITSGDPRLEVGSLQRPGISARDEAIDSLVTQNFDASLQYSQDPGKAIAYRLAAYRNVKAETDRLKDVELSPEYQSALDELRTGTIAEREQKINELLSGYAEKSADGKLRESSPQERKFLYTALDEFMEASIPDRMKQQANNPSGNLDEYDPVEFANMANSNAAQLFKNKDKMTPEQRSIEEDRMVFMLNAGDTLPVDWFKYLGEEYFVEGSSKEQMARGYELLELSAKTQYYRDPNTGAVRKLNMPTVGQVNAEISMFEGNEIMYNTVVIAQGMAIGTGQEVSIFLPQAHNEALRIQRTKDMTKDRVARNAGEMLPQPLINSMTGEPYSFNAGLIETQAREFRTVFSEVFNTVIPNQSEDDPTVILDPEDYMRMNAMYQSFKLNWGDEKLAMKSAVAMMAKMGYKVLTGDPTTSTSPRVQMIYDPFNIMPTQQTTTGERGMATGLWRRYLETKVAAAAKEGVIRGTVSLGNGAISMDLRADISRPDSLIPFRVDDLQGNSIYIPERFGISEADYQAWVREQRRQVDTQTRDLDLPGPLGP